MTTSSLLNPFIAEDSFWPAGQLPKSPIEMGLRELPGHPGLPIPFRSHMSPCASTAFGGGSDFWGEWSASKWLDGALGGLRNKSFKCMDLRGGEGRAGNTGDNGNTPQNKCRAVKFLQPPKKAVDADCALKWGRSGKWDMCVGPDRVCVQVRLRVSSSTPAPTLALVSNAKTGCGNAGGSARGL